MLGMRAAQLAKHRPIRKNKAPTATRCAVRDTRRTGGVAESVEEIVSIRKQPAPPARTSRWSGALWQLQGQPNAHNGAEVAWYYHYHSASCCAHAHKSAFTNVCVGGFAQRIFSAKMQLTSALI